MTTPATIIANWKAAAVFCPKSASASDARLLELVQRCYGQVWDMDDWKFKKKEANITTVAGTESYALASDFNFPQSWATPLKFTDGGDVGYSDEKDFYNRDRDADRGQPTKYSIAWDATTAAYKLSFWPVPDAAYVLPVPYIAKAATLISSTSLSIPDGHLRAVETLFYLKAYREFNHGGHYKDEIMQYMAEARECLRRLHADDRAGMVDMPHDVYGDTSLLCLTSDEEF